MNIQIFYWIFLGVEDSDDDSEEMSEFKFSTAPNSFFFLPMPIGRSSGFYKRAGTALPRPNGFMFPVGRRVGSIFNQKPGEFIKILKKYLTAKVPILKECHFGKMKL